MELAPRPEYGLITPLIRLEDGGARTFGSGRVSVRSAVPLAVADGTMHATFSVRAGDQLGFSLRWASVRGPQRSRADAGGAGDGADRRHRRGMALLGGRARRLPRRAPRSRPAQRAHPEGPHVPADRGDRGGAHDLAAGDGGRRAQLGLPVLVDPRLEPDARGAVHRRLPGRGRGVRVVHDQLGRRARQRGIAADHVRHRRRARPVRARAGTPRRVARLAARAGRQRGVEPGAARRLRRAPERAPPLSRAARRPASGDPGIRGRPRRHRRAAVARDRLGDLGDARRAAAPPVVEGHVLGRARPRGAARAAARRVREGRALARRARRDPRGDPDARLERGAAGVRAVVRRRTSSTARSC